MKQLLCLILAALLLTGCGANTPVQPVTPETEIQALETVPAEAAAAPEYVSRFSQVTEITLSDEGITVNGSGETDSVYTSQDIIYYEDRDSYASGNPYGEGSEEEKHSPEEAAAHTVVNITAPGAYRVSGTLSAGQLRIDLGENAKTDPDAVVELILSDANITCTVAPAILFLNTYECDHAWDTATAQPTVDTTAAGANLILEGSNTVSGSHVARIYKDGEGEKKLWKQDGAIYSYMSANVYGPGTLRLTADNEGLDTELHLSIHGGDIAIFSGNDGINTNEDGVSVTTINGGTLLIAAGLGEEGDGIDSNGYLVINGGTVFASANPAADAGMDSDLGSYIHGGTVVALGSTMDWAESDSRQVTMNLQFAQTQTGTLTLTDAGDSTIFTLDPAQVFGEYARSYTGAILSCPAFTQDSTLRLYIDGIPMQYTGTDVTRMPGGMGGGRGGFGQMPPDGEHPHARRSELELPEAFTLPEDFDPSAFPEDMAPPEGMERPPMPEGEVPFDPSAMGGRDPEGQDGIADTRFYLQDKVNAFSGIAAFEST